MHNSTIDGCITNVIADGAIVIATCDIDGLVQERSNSIANALELRLSCTNPSILSLKYNRSYKSV